MKFGIFGNIDKPVIVEVTTTLFSYLRERNHSFVIHDILGNWLNNQNATPKLDQSLLLRVDDLPRACDLLISLGGDGTTLAAARMVGTNGIPILGVNLGKLGFLAEVSIDELKECLDQIIRGDYSIDERMMLTAIAKSDGKVYHALNEIVVDRGESPRVIDLETYVNNDYLVTYAADGIIIATPTGSTAYSLASGGPLVAPQSKVITINPISPHTLTARPVIIPDTSTIKVVAHAGTKRVHITADGQVEGFYETPAEFTIQKAPYVIKLVKRKKRTYYDLLRTKLLWGKDLRIDPDSHT
ncbi:MAG: NAD(+)/NADH kinase [Ignavibacteria bacterium]|nr:NAD(+)/NADH kinase [Ignavibacteria bacterium]MBI3766008.1 NAD(+)/NADH kinase [Ignavibacteriales bacterium]